MARGPEGPAGERCGSRRRLRARAGRPLHRPPAPEDRRGPAPRRNPRVAERRNAAGASTQGRRAPMMEELTHQLHSLEHALVILPIAALLGGALGVIRPIRTVLVRRSSHVIQTQVLMAIVGAA